MATKTPPARPANHKALVGQSETPPAKCPPESKGNPETCAFPQSRSSELTPELVPAMRRVRRIEAISATAALGVLGIGSLAIIGWIFHLPVLMRVQPQMVAMKANAALCLVLLGISLWLAQQKRVSCRPYAMGVRIGAAVVLVIALLTLTEHVFQVNLGIDQLLFQDTTPEGLRNHPGRMAPNTAASLVLLGLALLLMDVETHGKLRPTELLACAGGMMSLTALFGYAYGAMHLYTVNTAYVPMALDTAMGLFLCALGIILVRPARGMMTVFIADYAGGWMMRQLLLPVLAFPLILDAGIRGAITFHIVDRNLAEAVYALLVMTVSAGLLWVTGTYLNRVDAARQSRTDEVFRLNTNLENLVQERTAELMATNHALEESRIAALSLMQEAIEAKESMEQINIALQNEVAERKRAESINQHYAAIIASSDDAIISTSLEGDIITWNPGAERLYGYTEEEVIGSPLSILIPPERADEESELLGRILQGEEVEHIETTRIHKGGTPIDVSLSLSPIKDTHGKVIGMSKIARDITERKRVEAALRESEASFRTLAEAMPQIVWATRPDGWNIYFNQRWVEYTGMTLEESYGHGWNIPFHPDDKQRSWEAWQRATQDIATYSLEVRLRRADGVYRWWLVRGEPLRDTTGNIVKWFGTCTDIHDLKQAETKLHLAHERLRRFIDANIIGVVIADENSAIVEANDYYLKLIGFTREEQQQGKVDWRALTPPEWLSADEKALSELRERGTCTPYEKEYVRRDGSRVQVLLADAMLPGPEGQIAAFALDLTERKQIEQEVLALNTTLEQRVAERTTALKAANQELDAFTYSVSHDLRAPVRAMIGFTHILTEEHGGQLPDEARRYLQRISDNAQKMGTLVDDLLAFSRMGRQSLQKQAVAPDSIVHQVWDELAPEREGRTVELKLGKLPPCQADPVLLKQVFFNLLANAIKFSHGREPACIEVGSYVENGENVYFVKDNGAGFDMQYVGKLFNVFQRLHSAAEFEGTGVGLAIVQRILNRHGGHIRAQAEVDKGATFYFSVSQESPSDAEDSAQNALCGTGGRELP